MDGAPRRAASLPSPFLSYGPTFRREFPPLDHLDLDLPSSRSPSPTRIFSRSTPLRPIHLPSSLPRCLLPPRHTRQLSSPPNALKSCSSLVLVPSSLVIFHSVPTQHMIPPFSGPRRDHPSRVILIPHHLNRSPCPPFTPCGIDGTHSHRTLSFSL